MSQALRRSIYREHVEECAMLFERRQLCVEDPESGLEDIAEHDARMDAHIDGLVLGREFALELCVGALEDGDPSIAHTVARVILRDPDAAETGLALFSSLLEVDDEYREERRAGLGAALNFELGAAWSAKLGPALDEPLLSPLLVRALGSRRLAEAAPLLRERLERAGADASPGLIWALGELRDHASLSRFHQLLDHAHDRLQWSALALACLKLGDPRIVSLLGSQSTLSGWSPVGQVLACDVPLAWLLDALGSEPNEMVLVALALLGDPGSFGALLELLGDETHGQLVAGVLFTITGAPLLAAAPEPEAIEAPEDEDDPDALDPGWMTLSREPGVWRAWLEADLDRWVVGQRYRLGQAIDRGSTARAALCCAVPLVIREVLFDELALCHGVDPRVRPDGLARQQLDAIRYGGPPPPVFDRKHAWARPADEGPSS